MPNKLNWDASYSVGNHMLDLQHKRLLALCNALADCIATDGFESDQQFHEILNDLANYAREHFTAEEQLLRRRQFPELATQIKDHADYQDKVTEILASATFGKLEKIALHEFLSHWWNDHILIHDMAYKAFLQRH